MQEECGLELLFCGLSRPRVRESSERGQTQARALSRLALLSKFELVWVEVNAEWRPRLVI